MRYFLILFFISLVFPGNCNMELIGSLEFDQELSDITGFYQDGREFVVVGLSGDAAAFVDITDPYNSFEVGRISGTPSIWRDLKYWNRHVYIGTEAEDGVRVVSVDSLNSPTLVNTITDFTSSHNIHIDSTGYLYVVGAAEHDVWIYELTDHPENPVRVGTWKGEYFHDIEVYNNKLYGAAIYSGYFYIIDVNDKTNPTTLASYNTGSGYISTHDCAVTDDEHYLITADEASGGHIKIWDISDYSNINLVSEYMTHPEHSVHNVYIRPETNLIIMSYYVDGTRVLDITDPANPVEVGFFDTSDLTGLYDGNWGTYAYLPSGYIVSSDQENGLFIFESPLTNSSMQWEECPDCNGVIGGDAYEDQCGVCGGSGIPDGQCDCDGNVFDCADECGGDDFSCSAGSTASDYFPMGIGYYWSAHEEPIGDDGWSPRTRITQIEAIDTINNEEYFRVKATESLYNESLTENTWYQWLRPGEDGNVFMGAMGDVPGDTVNAFDPPLQWPNGIFRIPGNYKSWKNDEDEGKCIRATLLSISETVEVPAGTFENCVIIELKFYNCADISDIQQIDNYYYAKDIGTVKIKRTFPDSSAHTSKLNCYGLVGDDGGCECLEGPEFCDCFGNILDECGVCGGNNSSCVLGCTDPEATNYNENATENDGSCECHEGYTPIDGECYYALNNHLLNGVWIVVQLENPAVYIIFNGEGLITRLGGYFMPDTAGWYSVDSDGGSISGSIWAEGTNFPYTGQILNETTADLNIVFEDTLASQMIKVMDEGACRGNWSGTFSDDVTNINHEVNMEIDESGLIVLGMASVFDDESLSGRFFYEAPYLVGHLSFGEDHHHEVDGIMWPSQIGIEGGSLLDNIMEGTYGADAENINGGIFSLIRETVNGCADPEACNYNPDANVDDGSCTYPETYYHCDGECIVDTDEDGVCDENELSIDDELIPTNYNINTIYPNPFNPTTTISFSIPEFGLTIITVYDITGRQLETLANEVLSIGNYSVNWNASDYPSGVYLIRMESREFTKTQKVVLVK